MPHTPGPWKYDRESNAIVSDVAMVDWSLDPDVCDQPIPVSVISTMGAMGGDDTAADVALLVASPMLAKALRSIIAAWDEPYYGDLSARCDWLFDAIEAARPTLADVPMPNE